MPGRYRDEAHAERVRSRARAAGRARYLANPERVRELQRASRRAIALRDREAALIKYGPGCQCCGEDREPFLLIDHVDGGGNVHRAQVVKARQGARAGGGPYFYRWLRLNGYPPGFQTLCANCNMAKERPGGCPHRTAEGGDANCA